MNISLGSLWKGKQSQVGIQIAQHLLHTLPNETLGWEGTCMEPVLGVSAVCRSHEVLAFVSAHLQHWWYLVGAGKEVEPWTLLLA